MQRQSARYMPIPPYNIVCNMRYGRLRDELEDNKKNTLI